MTILALLADDNKGNRQKGFNFIQTYRDNKNPDDSIRIFRKYRQDEVNLLCNDYSNFILYDKVDITEPPATFQISLEELQDIVDGKNLKKKFKTTKNAVFGLFSGAKIDFLPFLKMQNVFLYF